MLAKQVVFKKPKVVVIEEAEVSKPSPNQVQVQTLVSLISTGTELTMLSGDVPPRSHWEEIIRYPLVPGYSNCGKIIEVGRDVEAFDVGDRVVSTAKHTQYALLEGKNVQAYDFPVKVPDGVSDEEATFHNLGYTVMNGTRLAHIQLGESVVVVGMGILGQLACQFSRLCGGFPVIAVDLSEFRLKLAKELGATATLHSRKDIVEESILKLTKGRGADVVFEVTGNPRVIPWALSLVKRQGRYVQLSSPRGPSTVDFHDEVNWPSRTIIGTHVVSHPEFETPYNPWTRQRNTELFFDLITSGLVNVKNIITHRYPLDEAPKAYQMLLDPTGPRLQAMGVLLDFRQ